MSFETQFRETLDRLYERRTDKLRRIVFRKPGNPLSLAKKRREKKILELQEIASKALAKKMAKKGFKTLVVKKKTWRTKGWGTDKKLRIFRAWVRKRLAPKRGKVYVFWKNRECRYVGRTGGRGGRPSRHFTRGWFNGTTRIDVYMTQQRKSISQLECLAIHRFRPTKNKIKPAKENWKPKCPLCTIHKRIRTEVRKIYRFR
jgi:hypothetical protein